MNPATIVISRTSWFHGCALRDRNYLQSWIFYQITYSMKWTHNQDFNCLAWSVNEICIPDLAQILILGPLRWLLLQFVYGWPDWFCYGVVRFRWLFQLLNLGLQTFWYFRRKSHLNITIFIKNAFFQESCSCKGSLYWAEIFIGYILLCILARVKISELYHILLTSYGVPNCPKMWLSSYFRWVIKKMKGTILWPQTCTVSITRRYIC